MTAFEIKMNLRKIREFARAQESDTPKMNQLWNELFRQADNAYEAASRIEDEQEVGK